MKILVAALALLASSCASLVAVPRIGRMNVDGHLGIADASTGVTATNDLEAIGLDDDDGVLGVRLDAQAGPAHATFALSGSSHGGSGTLQATIDNGSGTTIPAGTAIDSDFDLTLGEAMVTWDLAPGEAVEIGIGVGATVFDLDSNFTDRGSGDSIDAQQALPIPLIALRAGVDLGRVDLSALLGAIDVRYGDSEASFYDLDLMARLQLLGGEGNLLGSLVAGWRSVKLSADFEDGGEEVDATARLSGPYLGLSIGF